MCSEVLHHFSVQDMSLVFNGDVKLSKLEVGQVGDLFPELDLEVDRTTSWDGVR